MEYLRLKILHSLQYAFVTWMQTLYDWWKGEKKIHSKDRCG